MEKERIYSDQKIEALIFDIKQSKGFKCPNCMSETFYLRNSMPFARMCADCKRIEGLRANTALHKTKIPLSIALEILLSLRRNQSLVFKELVKAVPLEVIRQYMRSGKRIKDMLRENRDSLSNDLFKNKFLATSMYIKRKYKKEIDPKTIYSFLLNVGNHFKGIKETQARKAEIVKAYGVYYALFIGNELAKKENLVAWWNIVRLLFREPDLRSRSVRDILVCLVNKEFV